MFSCYGEMDGMIDLEVFWWEWHLFPISGMSMNSRKIWKIWNPDFYVCTIADDMGCQRVTDTIEISEPPEIIPRSGFYSGKC